MGGFSIWHWLVVGIIILLLFGKGRFSSMMGDVASGLKSFKKGMEEEEAAPAPRTLTREPSGPAGHVVDVTPSAAGVTDGDEVKRP